MIKSLEQFYDADERMSHFVLVDPGTGDWRPMTLADHYESVASVGLSPSVPEAIVAHFDAARHVLIYSWLVYEMSAIAEQQIYSTIEFALKSRLGAFASGGARRRGFKELLAKAVDLGLLRDDGFADYHPRVENSASTPNAEIIPSGGASSERSKCDILVDALPRLRNHLAHGAIYVNTPGNVLDIVRVARDLINQLFESAA